LLGRKPKQPNQKLHREKLALDKGTQPTTTVRRNHVKDAIIGGISAVIGGLVMFLVQ